MSSLNQPKGTCGKNCGQEEKGSPGFQPSVWGPGLWMVMHMITLNFPKKPTLDEKRWYKTFFMSLGHVLPCHECQQHFIEHYEKTLAKNDDILESKESLAKWLFQFHNIVNKRSKKADPFKTYDEMAEFYSQFTSGKPKWVSTLKISPVRESDRS